MAVHNTSIDIDSRSYAHSRERRIPPKNSLCRRHAPARPPMRFVDIDEQERGPSAESARAIGVEAQEAANQLRYERALRLQGSGKVEAAAECFRELLAQRERTCSSASP